MAPLFVVLPDDRCQCAHWGHAVQGKATFKCYTGTEAIEFSPTEALHQTLEVVEKNMAAAG